MAVLGRNDFGITNINNHFGRYRNGGGASGEVWFVDNQAKKTELLPRFASVMTRTDFGEENFLIECKHTIYGSLHAFIPAIGAVGDGPLEDVHTPPWASLGFGGAFARKQGSIYVSVHSELIYQVYLKLAEQKVAESGQVEDSDVPILTTRARDLVNSLPGLSAEFLTDSEYLLTPGGVSSGLSDIAEGYVAMAPIMEQARFITEAVPGLENDVSLLVNDIAEGLLGRELSRNLSTLVGVSYFSEDMTSLVNDPGFDNGLSNWTEWRNTEQTNEALSSVSVFYDDNENTVFMELESNSKKDQTSYQHGIEQIVPISQSQAGDTFLVARYSELSGLLEEGEFLRGGEDSGAAIIAIEYLNDAAEKIGGTYFANTSQGLFTDSGFYNAPVSLSAGDNEFVYQAPAAGNNALVVNIGSEAQRAIGSRADELAYVRLAVVVADYIGSKYLRHFLTGIILSGTPECNACKAKIRVHSLDLVTDSD